MSEIRIERISVVDLRFPTSREAIGSDAVNKDPDYSAAYCILHTNADVEGHGLTFTLGRGTDLVARAVEFLGQKLIGRTLDSLVDNMAAFSRELTEESQFRWLGPQKGVTHLAAAAVLNAVWDLWAKASKKPVWLLLAEMDTEQLLRCIDFQYIDDLLSVDDARAILNASRASMEERKALLLAEGYPAYTTSVGWFGYSEEKIRRLAREGIAQGWTHFKLKVGGDPAEDLRRGKIIREEIGWENRLMVDANQRWGVLEAIERTNQLAELKPWWMEEPTSPDDILGHARIRRECKPVRIATGEHCHNRVMFKQLLQAEAIDVCQIDSCRVASVNENLAIILMAHKSGVVVCPHAGGVGLCEYVQHLSAFDFLRVSCTMKDRVIEYVDHLHEHFITPVRIDKARYWMPLEPGYSIEIYPQTLKDFAYPDGREWKSPQA